MLELGVLGSVLLPLKPAANPQEAEVLRFSLAEYPMLFSLESRGGL